jgi:hypothetical protein
MNDVVDNFRFELVPGPHLPDAVRRLARALPQGARVTVTIEGVPSDPVPLPIIVRRTAKHMGRKCGIVLRWPTTPAPATPASPETSPTHSPAPRPRTRLRASGAVSPEVSPDE